jgi:predicted nucleic acid-binding protein
VPETISNTSPIQYLYQAGLLELLPTLYGRVIIPAAVADELASGRELGVRLPDPSELAWITIERPADGTLLRIVADLGPGEREVIALGLSLPGSLLLLDDAVARRYAKHLNLRVTGTLGVLLKAKSLGHLPLVRPVLDRLDALRFRLDPATRATVVKLAGEP